MKVRRASKHELAEGWHERYCGAGRAEKSRLLDEYVGVTGYHRKYALKLLRQGPPEAGAATRSGRPERYGPQVMAALVVAAQASGWICGKRLAPFLEELVPALEREGALVLDPLVREQLLALSAATIDRRLRAVRAQYKPKGLCTTKPGSLLKAQIPISTHIPWDRQRPGFVELDLVAHCGTHNDGEYICTLTAVDVATGWCECSACLGRSQAQVLAALERIRTRLPFPLLGIDSDNGSEFINAQLLRYCRKENLTFTRCRPYQKNDQAHVEQKNWAIVRQTVGYDRFEGEDAQRRLEQLYGLVRIYTNVYQPLMKLVSKEREGAKVYKRYDSARTPYRRALAAGVLSETTRTRWTAILDTCGPLHLHQLIERHQHHLWALALPFPFPSSFGKLLL